jgi:hypothetical protein
MNELIGLQYKWGANPDIDKGFSDCFQLACAVRRRLGLHDHANDFAWAYERYEGTLPPIRMARWLLTHARRTRQPLRGCLAMGNSQQAALATITDNAIICIAPRGRSVSLPLSSKAINSLQWFLPNSDA